jgi:signal transduction histidine kinase
MRSLVRPLVSVTTYRRWTFLLGGTALLVPYLLIYAGVVQIMGDARQRPTGDVLEGLIMLIAFVAISSAVAFVPAVRILCRTAVETLLGVTLPEETPEGLRSWRSRRRTAVWWALHIGVGGAVGFAAVVGLPMLLFLLATPFTGQTLRSRFLGSLSVTPAWSVALALLLAPVIIYLGAGTGWVLARLAPVFLGPSPADRLARLERQAESLIERNRLARELHDSVGHALTATTLQAGAALRVLDSDPEFARRALAAIEETGRTALEDLDHVLGLLREDASATTPQRTLADLGRLFDQTRSAGLEVDAAVDAEVGGVPPVVSREAYRIVQESLTNALRHAGKVRVTVRLAVRASRLELEMSNPTGAAAPPHTGGGRGIPGIRERVTILGGRMSAGADGGCWRVLVTIPVVPWRDDIQRAGVHE